MALFGKQRQWKRIAPLSSACDDILGSQTDGTAPDCPSMSNLVPSKLLYLLSFLFQRTDNIFSKSIYKTLKKYL